MINSTNSTPPPETIYKEEEFNEMCRIIRELFIYSDTNLATALHVDRKTIAGWKQRPEAILAHKDAVNAVLKLRKSKQMDANKSLKELGIETEPESVDVNMRVIIEDYTV